MGRCSWLSDPVSRVVRLAGCARLHLVSARHSYHVHLARLCTGRRCGEAHGVCAWLNYRQRTRFCLCVRRSSPYVIAVRARITRRSASICLPTPVYAAQL